MKILILSTADIYGGAAKAAYRLHIGLKNQHINSKMLVQQKYSDDITVIGSNTKWERIKTRLYSMIEDQFKFIFKKEFVSFYSPAIVSSVNFKKIELLNPDIVNLHWINNGFLKPEDFKKLDSPIVWTLHDMWAFSGAEHYVGEDTQYQNRYISKNKIFNLNKWVWKRKKKSFKNIENLTIVTPSNWLADCVSKSTLLKKHKTVVIHNGLDTLIFKPIDKKIARNILNLPQNKKLILFGAINGINDPRKGFKYLKKAFEKVSKIDIKSQVELVVFGSSKPEKPLNLFIKTHFFGKITDDTMLSLLYSAADMMVTPSLEDNLPNTIMESLACGTPVVAFDIGGISDLIDHKQNGYLAKPKDAADLFNGINWIIKDKTRYIYLAQQARKKVKENFNQEIQSQKYIDLYKSILNKK